MISNIDWPIPESMRKSFDQMFDVVTYSQVHGMRKPHQSIFLDTLQGLGVEPSQAGHVGDAYEADIIGAKNAGMFAIHI